MYKIIGANQTEYGPVSGDQIRQWIAEGRVNAQTSAQAEGETGWKPISTFPEFAASFPSPSAPPSLSPPPLGTTVAPELGALQARGEVSGPAIGLMVTAVLGIAYGALGILGQLIGVTFNNFSHYSQFNFPGQNEDVMRVFQMSSGILGVVFSVFKIGLGIFVLYGALKMKDLQKHTLCILASIVALIPCISPCCCVGIPIGIWALIVLNKPEVRDYFS
jgi:hypothetical protein